MMKSFNKKNFNHAMDINNILATQEKFKGKNGKKKKKVLNWLTFLSISAPNFLQ